MMAPTVITTRVYKAHFDTGDFDPYANGGTPPVALPMFSAYVLADNIETAIAKLKATFPKEIITSLHCESERSLGNGKSEPEKVVL